MKVIYDANNAYAEQYQALFNELAEFVTKNFPEVDEKYKTINSLVEYYRALNYCIESDKANSIPFKFFRVPLDEEPFKVDLTTRTIAVPSSFQSNGLGILGDANAEIIIFEIDRFYDGVDLYSMVGGTNGDCWVQWTNTGDKTSGNTSVTMGDVNEEKMYAAWLITPEMTKTAGTIEFALRFFTKDRDDNITYSLNTQKATCAVKNTLNVSMSEGVESDREKLKDLIFSRPIYSNVINSMDSSAPIIDPNLTEAIVDLVTEGEDYEKYNEVFPNGVYKLTVGGKSVDDGEIVYRWYKGNQMAREPLDNDTYDDRTPDKKYGESAEDASYIVTEAGVYFCKVGNSVEDKGTRWVDSNTVLVPFASEIRISDSAYLPHKAYIIKEDKTGYGIKLIYTPYNFKVDGSNGELFYEWNATTLEGAPIEDIGTIGETNDGLFVPKVSETPGTEKEFILSCFVKNKKNNSVSNILEAPKCTYRALPSEPATVDLSHVVSGKTGSISVVATFDGDTASSKHSDEWTYVWEYGELGEGTSQVPSNMLVKNNPKQITIPSSLFGSGKTYRFECAVQHVVFSDDKNLRAVGPSKRGGISLHFDTDNTVKEV